MTKAKFMEFFGDRIVPVSHDDIESGDLMLFHPEETHIAMEYYRQGYLIVEIFESENPEEDFIKIRDIPDFGNSFCKTGYFVVTPTIKT